MNKPNNIWMLGFYIGQNVVIHPVHGTYMLSGFYDSGVFAKRNNTGIPEDEETEMFEFDEIKLKLKPVDKSLLKEYSDSLRFIRFKTDNGYWIGNQELFNSDLIKEMP